MPTWLLAVATGACLTGAIWLFFGNDGGGTDSSTAPTEQSQREQAESELSVPDDEEPTDDRRRGEDGRDRLDPDDATDAADSESLPDDLPPVLANVRDREVALLVASAAAPADATDRVEVGDLQVQCSAAADSDRAGIESAVLDEVEDVLERAGATVVRADDPAGCLDARVERLHAADLALVLRAGDDDPRVFAGRPTDGDSTPERSSVALAAELAAVLDLDALSTIRSTADRTLVTEAGALDLPGGAAVAFVELDAADVTTEGLDELATSLATAIGVAASRRDVEGESANG